MNPFQLPHMGILWPHAPLLGKVVNDDVTLEHFPFIYTAGNTFGGSPDWKVSFVHGPFQFLKTHGVSLRYIPRIFCGSD